MDLFERVRLFFAVGVCTAALAACGGGGGGGGGSVTPVGPGGGATPTPSPTTVPVSGGYVAPSGGVTPLGPNASNVFASSLLAASTDGTFIVQSLETPAQPSGAASALTEYDVAASESAAGQKPSSLGQRFAAAIVALRQDGAAPMPNRVRRDFGQVAISQTNRRILSTLRVAGANARSAMRSTSASAFSAGAQRTFHVFQAPITGTTATCTAPQIKIGTDCYLDVPATLQAISNHGYVWVDNGIDATYNFGAADFQATASAFDVDYARETTAFGPAFFTTGNFYRQCDANGVRNPNVNTYAPPVDYSGTDPHISILITKALENTGEGGYFYAGDLLNDQELNCAYGSSAHKPSNQLPMFIMAADKYSSSADESYWRTQDMPRTVPHEFQHYLHAINKVFAANLRDGNTSATFDDSFVDEGNSMLAEDLVNPNNAQSNDTLLASWWYLYSPGNYSLTAWVGYDSDPLDTSNNPTFGFYRSTEGNYGAGYLFARYMYDRFGGDAALHRVYASLTPTAGGGANVAPIVAEANNGETFAQLYAEFAAALAARNVASTDPRFSFNSTVFLVGKKMVSAPGATWDVVMNGPRSPEDLTSTHLYAPGSSRIRLTPTHAASAKLMTGATLFFNAGQSAGSIVSLDSATAPSGTVAGALVQGGYTDTGACLGPASSGC
jgi:hypothetical protein